MVNLNPKVNDKFGYWESSDAHHGVDETLKDAIHTYLKSKSIKSMYDFGCGLGLYTNYYLTMGYDCKGFDGNPFVFEQSGGSCEVLNLAEKQELEPRDLVLCLEVGEHIPQQYESILIDNIHRSNTQGVLLSWAIPGQGGVGHFNERPITYIKSIFKDLGYINNLEEENRLKSEASLPWFKNTLMVFEK